MCHQASADQKNQIDLKITLSFQNLTYSNSNSLKQVVKQLRKR